MMPGVSEVWEEIGGGGAGRLSGAFNPAAPWRFEALSENSMAEMMSYSSSQREMESLTRALQRELCSANYENELMSFGAASFRNSEWKCKAETKILLTSDFSEKPKNHVSGSTLYEADERTKKNNNNNVSELLKNSCNGGFEEKGMNLKKGGGSDAESLAGKGKGSSSLSVNGAGKVSKRKSRAASKTPITFLNADPANFRAMVQQVTGVPLNPNATRLWPPASGGVGVPALLKPEPKRPSSSAASIIQGLPTLDTSALFIHSARQNPASAAELRSFSGGAAPFLTEKLRAACMQPLTKNNGGGGGFAVDEEASEADSWLDASNFDGILSSAAVSLPM